MHRHEYAGGDERRVIKKDERIAMQDLWGGNQNK